MVRPLTCQVVGFFWKPLPFFRTNPCDMVPFSKPSATSCSRRHHSLARASLLAINLNATLLSGGRFSRDAFWTCGNQQVCHIHFSGWHTCDSLPMLLAGRALRVEVGLLSTLWIHRVWTLSCILGNTIVLSVSSGTDKKTQFCLPMMQYRSYCSASHTHTHTLDGLHCAILISGSDNRCLSNWYLLIDSTQSVEKLDLKARNCRQNGNL